MLLNKTNVQSIHSRINLAPRKITQTTMQHPVALLQM